LSVLKGIKESEKLEADRIVSGDSRRDAGGD
jgi:hypothetical protein